MVIIYVHVLVRTAQAEMGGYVDNLCNTAQISITHTLKSNTKSVIPLCLLKTKILLLNLTGNVSGIFFFLNSTGVRSDYKL